MAIAQLGRENEVSKMVKALANMLRTSLGTVEALVPVIEEIRHCEQYLSIQNIRYQNKFQTFWHVDPSIHDCHIIRITLQPIVENAIYHGIKHLSKPGRLNISIQREDELLNITVRDNGLGMTEEKLREVTQQMNEDLFQQSKHIGLANVYQRIKLFYGEDCSFTIRSILGEGTEITLRVPIK
jgi:two-component system sensor histidine kinase YesM